MHKRFLRIGSLLMAFSVLLGAFGAHSLKTLLDESSMQAYHTAVLYHMVHAVGMIIASLIYKRYQTPSTRWALYFFLAGLICFSGSLYAIAIGKVIGFSFPTFFNLITPLGGVLFIIGWIALFFGVPSEKEGEQPESRQ
ncbi:MAG: DUF423 domain-containing protein [Bacteroidetes bacterium]|nr:DUF423 domain-containing protein [Bacteroidota bacterium]